MAVTAGADVRDGPGMDMKVVGHAAFGTVETFNGWYARGDDPPVPDYRSHALEEWSQDWFRLEDGSGWIHSAYVEGMQPSGMAHVAWTPPPVRNVPAAAPGEHLIVVSTTRQHLWAFDGSRLVLDTQVGTGRRALPTPPGTYHVFAKRSPYHFVSPWPTWSPYWYEPSWSKYAMEFLGGGYFIHDASWRWRWGPGANLVEGSHGCVNVPIAAMTPLWNWTRVGDRVVVQTP